MSVFSPDTSNELFQLAIQLVNESNRNIFLTGKAGTGKTTFLKYIRNNCPKQMAVVAPTGVAAINAGGVTMHSFFQLPLSPFIPEAGPAFGQDNNTMTNRQALLKGLRFNSEKRKLLQQLELLIIDEISMVRCDVLDAMDVVLRHARHRPLERFGGLQVLFIGDMLQLPPVVKEQEWSILSRYYKGPYFFNSKVVEEAPPVYIEFNKIYRQNEESFLRLLNQVRDNQLDDEGLKILESRYDPYFNPSNQDGYIILTTHNNKAAEINSSELSRIDNPVFTYNAVIEKEFPDRAYPAELTLQLKVGAQVMFIRNDSSERGKRYFNGKIGIVTRLETDKIMVSCQEEDLPAGSVEISVQKEIWENIRYKLNKATSQLDSETLGSFTQYPLRLAWAITIHKSQGLTFEKAIIDAGQAFAPGQVYVALSRCTRLDGMVLRSALRTTGIFSDPVIVEFSKKYASTGKLQEELSEAKKLYRQSILLSTFNFTALVKSSSELYLFFQEHKSTFDPAPFTWFNEVLAKLSHLDTTAQKFHSELKLLFQVVDEDQESQLQNRIKAASAYFFSEIEKAMTLLQKCPSITDSWIISKDCNDSLKDVFEQLALKKHMLAVSGANLDLSRYHQHRKNFVVPRFAVNVYAGSTKSVTVSQHPVLHQQLKKLRDSICMRNNLPVYLVVGTKTLEEMTRYLPQTLAELRQVSGFGDSKIEKYGNEFLDLVVAYSQEHGLGSLIHEKVPKRERLPGEKRLLKKNTREESFRLFSEGKTVEEIATERKLAISTIETHLAEHIRNGRIHIDELLSTGKQVMIETALKDWDGVSLTFLKNKLGDEISFCDLKYGIAWSDHNTINSETS